MEVVFRGKELFTHCDFSADFPGFSRPPPPLTFDLLQQLFLVNFPGGSDGKVSVYNAGDLGLIPGLGRSLGEGNGNPLQWIAILLPGKSHGQRSLIGYSPWGRKESDTTNWLHFHFPQTWLRLSQNLILFPNSCMCFSPTSKCPDLPHF